MPYHPNIGQEIVRGSICRDHWQVTVSILCGDRVPLNQPSPLVVSVDWRRRPDEGTTPDQPGGSTGVRLRFRKLSERGTGEIRFRTAAGALEDHWDFPGDAAEQVLTLVGTAATVGTEADVMLDVIVEDRDPVAFPMSVGAPGSEVRITAENGTDAPPAAIPLEQPTRLRAVPTPAAAGTFRWATLTPGVEIRGERTATGEVVGHLPAPPVYVRPARVYALYAPPGQERRAYVAAHDVELGSQEQAFAQFHHLDEAHLRDPAFRARLEALRPPEVQAYVDRATEEHAPDSVTGYLTRLLAFANEQEPLRAASEGERESITFIMGQDPQGSGNAFYRGAEAFYRLYPAGTLVPARDLTTRAGGPVLRDVRDYLAAHPPANGRPWGEVNVVVHANEEGGMSVPARPLTQEEAQNADAHHANPISLEEAVAADEFTALPDGVVDARTVLQIRGCALGRNPDMLHVLSVAFGGDEPRRPVVRAPRHLQAYSFGPAGWSPLGTPPPARAENYFIEFWLEGFPTRHRPSNAVLADRFRADFPGVAVNWAQGLAHPGTPSGDTLTSETRPREYSFSFSTQYFPIPANDAQLATLLRAADPQFAQAQNVHETERGAPDADGRMRIDFEWTLNGAGRTGFIDVGPAPPANDTQRIALIEATPEVAADMNRMGHAVSDYDWTFQVGDTPAANGRRLFTLQAEGSHTVLRVERELREPDPDHPGQTRRMHPAVTDLTHFGEEVPVRPPAQPPGQNVTFP
ncbi:MAG: hypothetical protein JO040_05135 [Gemmatimonadetes bacterium]|nr:hypothetical protein [Gemmatimonadota bacterium]